MRRTKEGDMTGYARRIQWLQPDPMREVYKTARSGEAGGCVRVRRLRRPGEVCFSVRDRGTKWLNLDGGSSIAAASPPGNSRRMG